MNIKFRVPVESDAIDIAAWKYDGEYSFYDNDKTEAKYEWACNIYKKENNFVIYNENNELIGNCNFDYDDEEEMYYFGVQMRPNFTGRGMGTEVVNAILEFGMGKYKFDKVKLLVAKFNKRAIRVYEKLGFEKVDEFMWFVNNEEKEFITMKKIF